MALPISIVIGSLDSGGCERHLLAVLPELNRNQGFNIEVFTLTRRGALASEFERRGVKVIPPWFSAGNQPLSYPARILRLAILSLNLAYYFVFTKPKVAHFFLPASYLIGGTIAFLCRVNFLLMSRRSLNDYQHKHPLSARFERLLHPRMDTLLGNSNAVVRQLRDECPDHPDIRLLYNGIAIPDLLDSDEREKLRSSLGIPKECLALGIVANLIPYKGHEDLLQACALLRGGLGMPWQLYIIGRDDGIQNSLEKMAMDLKIHNQVLFLGEMASAKDVLQAFDVGISASHEEGFSNSILEFMAASVPVVATDVGGSSEAVTHGENGFLVPPKEPSLLVKSIALLLENCDLRKQLGCNGRNEVIKSFSIARCVDAYHALYSEFNAKSSP